MPTAVDLTGRRFGRLVVLGQASRSRYWVCQCDCGRQKEIFSTNLTGGLTASCNCARTEQHRARLLRHGDTARVNGTVRHTKEFQAWYGAKYRCFNPRDGGYKRYGGRGITMCEEWRNDYAAFLRDMGRAPTKKHSLDRIDVNGPYAPGNCRWATDSEQQNNRRSNRYLSYAGRVVTLAQLAAETGVKASTLISRLDRGWSVDEAVSQDDHRMLLKNR